MKFGSPGRVRTGVDLPLVGVLTTTDFPGVFTLLTTVPVLSRRGPEPGVPTITKFAASAAVVTRARVDDGVR